MPFVKGQKAPKKGEKITPTEAPQSTPEAQTAPTEAKKSTISMEEILERMESQQAELDKIKNENKMLVSLQNRDKMDDYMRKNSPKGAQQFRILSIDKPDENGNITRYYIQYLRGTTKMQKMGDTTIKTQAVHVKGVDKDGNTIDEVIDHSIFNSLTSNSDRNVPLKEIRQGTYYDESWRPTPHPMYVFDINTGDNVIELEIPYALVNGV